MTEENKELFKQALAEGVSRRFDRELAQARLTIAEFVKCFPGFRFKLEFKHLNPDGTTELDEEYCYYGAAEEFEYRMKEYSWLFDIGLAERDVVVAKVNKRTRLVDIQVEYEH